jgi:hypothetical protein
VRDGYGPKTAICWNVYLEVIEELGTAESLVRDLARALRDVKRVCADGQVGNLTWPKVCKIVDAAVAGIPKHLSAPETPAREKSGSVLRQEGK